jgi:GT2 family glycosyltransferase
MNKQQIIVASIVLYNNPRKDVEECLRSLYLTSVSKIIIIDNSPIDTFRNILESREKIEYFHNPANTGYGAGHNIGILRSQEISSDYHLIINADISFKKNILIDILDYMNENKNVGAIMPKVYYPSGQTQQLCKFIPTPFDLFARRFLPKFLRNYNEKKFKMMSYDKNQILAVPYLSGCFMFVRSKVFREIGLFDEQFFMYPEDIDISRRIFNCFDTIYFPRVSIIHNHEQASKQSLGMLLVHIVNMVKYFNKWGWIYDYDRKIKNQTIKVKNQGKKL